MTGFQTTVQLNQAYGMPAELLVQYPHSTVAALPGELTANSAGVTIGQFAWAEDSTGVTSNAKPDLTSTRFGYVHRNQRSLITTYLAESTYTVLPGGEISLVDSGHISHIAPTGGATIGQKLFAPYAGGIPSLGTAGSPPTTTGTIGTTSSSAAITYTPSSLTLAPGMPISGTGIPTGTLIASVNATAGTAVLSAAATASGTPTATVTTAYETRFYVKTPGVAGDLFIISTVGF